MHVIYIIRHCAAQGQSSDCELTENGLKQAKSLANFFNNVKIDRIISSPFLRAIQSIEPLSTRKNVKIEIEERLTERILSTRDLPDWYEKLKATFYDMELKYDGGESSQEAMNRIVHVVNETFTSGTENTIIVSHGNIISLLLKHYQRDINFQVWENLRNPDVFQLSNIHNEVTIKRIWDEEKA
ncbi:histidine phosphatase family protein [Lysinibacillus parviboronicapiens]|uniref:histidine phosphatase family protein n=1 Tax=Lysinibacillus parviboronicapiens TaxID=436516 RepID=UPI000D355E7E|nr:histidine phosphatase family protein [Lysinibacillus parviboronicapiens]